MQFDDRPFMVRNYDWHLGHAMVMINQPGIVKPALSFDNPAQWTSKYGSVTVNQYGRELPCDGINQAGLAIAVLWLEETQYPKPDKRPSVSVAQWVQYQLDTASFVAEVIESDASIRISTIGGAKVHYFVCDAKGDCAVIEFLSGRMVVHRDRDLRYRQITNHSVVASQQHLASFRGFGGDHAIPASGDSLSRYVRLASVATQANLSSAQPHAEALDTIHQVRQGSTRWQIAYDLEKRKLYFRTREHQPVRNVSLDECEFDPVNVVKVLDLQSPLAGNVIDEFRPYSRRANRSLVERSLKDSQFVKGLPLGIVEIAIAYPDFACRPAAPAAVQ